MICCGNGILEQIKDTKIYIYEGRITLELLNKFIKDLMVSTEPKEPVWHWHCINTVVYSGNNLEEIRNNKLSALHNAQSIKKIQGYSPKLIFRYGKNNQRKNRAFRK